MNVKLLNALFFILLLSVAFSSCKKDEEEQESYLNSFTSLVAEKDTIFTGETTKITATVDGQNLKFKWDATAGDILGANSVVTYAAPTCVPGVNEISCTASADNKSETKTITITVF